ncbi:uncharacterized protein LOC119894906 [Scomber scombrus]|uniref:Uncharacterized protein LOC119894906 n=1 Tax=Scomber scombrus TaxID=13677 RepID=A0AAV1P9I8_SCOSC
MSGSNVRGELRIDHSQHETHPPREPWKSSVFLQTHRLLENPALLLPHHPVRKTINPTIRGTKQRAEPGHRWLRVVSASHHAPAVPLSSNALHRLHFFRNIRRLPRLNVHVYGGTPHNQILPLNQI